MKEFLICALKGETSLQFLNIKTGKKLFQIEMPKIVGQVKSLHKGWLTVSGLKDEGLFTYNVYKDEFYPGIFRVTGTILNDILFLPNIKTLIVSYDDACFSMFTLLDSSHFGLY